MLFLLKAFNIIEFNIIQGTKVPLYGMAKVISTTQAMEYKEFDCKIHNYISGGADNIKTDQRLSDEKRV